MTELTQKDLDDIKQVEKMAAIGLNQEQIAAMFDLTVHQFANRLAKYPELRAAFDKGRAKGIAYMAGLLYERAKTDNSCLFFYLKTRGGFSEKHHVEHTGNVTVTPELKTAQRIIDMSDDEIEERIQQIEGEVVRLDKYQKRIPAAETGKTGS